MQSKNDGFAAFDADNTHYFLNEIPFADHGALLDPPTSDVSARCVMLLAPLIEKHDRYRPVVERCLQYLYREQEEDGSWFGRWGTNYIYGTWSVLAGLEQAGIGGENPHVKKAVNWLKQEQHADGGWGEGNDTYYKPAELKRKKWRSNSFQTAWALLGLMAAGEADCGSVERGIHVVLRPGRQIVWRLFRQIAGTLLDFIYPRDRALQISLFCKHSALVEQRLGYP